MQQCVCARAISNALIQAGQTKDIVNLVFGFQDSLKYIVYVPESDFINRRISETKKVAEGRLVFYEM